MLSNARNLSGFTSTLNIIIGGGRGGGGAAWIQDGSLLTYFLKYLSNTWYYKVTLLLMFGKFQVVAMCDPMQLFL